MLITIPHMGNVYLAAKALFDGLEIPYIIPDINNKTTLQIGSFYSPEEICLPFKLMMGNYIEGIKKGADTMLMVGSCGPCRFGEYCQLQMKTLNKLGNNLDFIVIDYISDIGKKEFFNRIRKVASPSSHTRFEKIKAFQMAIKIINLLDGIDAKAHNLAGYEVHKGQCKQLLNRCKVEAMKCTSPQQMIDLIKDYKNKLSAVEIDENSDPLKIAIIGEIFTVIEPYSNLNIEEKLMDYGVSTARHLTPSWWVKDAILKTIKLNSLDLKRASKDYLSLNIGGHAQECIGEAMLAQKKGMDGAIQIFPLGCMPEIVSKSILPSIQKDKNFPIMSLIVDEMTGESGYITRIEAFLDMLKTKKSNYAKELNMQQKIRNGIKTERRM